MKAFTLKRLAKLMNLSWKGSRDRAVRGVCVDSRLLKTGDVFFALPGSQVDGHTFLPEVASKGASAAVVSQTYNGMDYGLPLLYVPDVMDALQLAAKNFLSESSAKVIALTGSVGKTTTKDFTTALLKQKYNVASSPGNSNSQIGVPLAILNHTDGTEDIVVLEMGMTVPGNIKKLINIAPPDIAVLTTVALVHACNFQSLDEIALTKAEIFSHPKTSLGVLSYDINNYSEVCRLSPCPKVSFSVTSEGADYFLKSAKESMHVHEIDGSVVELPMLSFPGKHNQHNFLAAAAVARALGVSWDQIREAVQVLALPERRLQLVEKKGVLFVNDSYNASAVSVKAALSSLPSPSPGRKKIAVLGEMLELGKFSEGCHREVADYALDTVDEMYCLGNECLAIKDSWQKANRPVMWSTDRSELVEALRRVLEPGDVVLLKGSRSKGMWKVLEEY